MGSVAGSGRSPGIGNGNLLQYSCLENPIDREAWWATVHRVAKSWTQLSDRARILASQFSVTCACLLSHFSVQLFATLWTVARQASLSMRFPRQEHWSGLPFPSPGIFLTQGSNPHLPHWQASSLPLSHEGSPKLKE